METNLAKNSGSKSDISASALKDVQKNVDDLNKKINSMETNLAKNSNSKSDISASALKDMQKNINDINSKINNVESSLASLGKECCKLFRMPCPLSWLRHIAAILETALRMSTRR